MSLLWYPKKFKCWLKLGVRDQRQVHATDFFIWRLLGILRVIEPRVVFPQFLVKFPLGCCQGPHIWHSSHLKKKDRCSIPYPVKATVLINQILYVVFQLNHCPTSSVEIRDQRSGDVLTHRALLAGSRKTEID